MLRRKVFDRTGQLVEHTFNGVAQSLDEPIQRNHSSLSKEVGVGTELKKLLSRLGLKPAANCKCAQHIREMNQEGVYWCEENTDTIVGWLKEEAERAKLPFTSIGARIIVRRAIRNANKKGAGITA